MLFGLMLFGLMLINIHPTLPQQSSAMPESA